MSEDINVGAISEALNNKVDLNQLNTSSAGLSYGSSWGMPSDNYEDLTLGASGTTYTAPANGYINLQLASTNSNNLSVSIIRNDNLYTAQSSDQTSAMYGLVLPVTKGNSFIVGYSDTNFNLEHFRFYYAVGEEVV